MELEGEEDPEDPEEVKDSKDSAHKSVSSREIREIQKQEFTRMKKSPRNKKGSPAAKERVVKRKTPTPLEGSDRSY